MKVNCTYASKYQYVINRNLDTHCWLLWKAYIVQASSDMRKQIKALIINALGQFNSGKQFYSNPLEVV